MAVSETSQGLGNLTTVSWTAMEGTNLSAPELAAANKDVETASTIAQALLEAANAAFNLGWQTYSLNDLQAGAQLGSLGLLDRTSLQSPPDKDTPDDWSAFMAHALGGGPAADEPLTLAQWRRLADDLQQFSASRASERSNSDQAWGGVTHANGRWFVNGQTVSLLDLYTAARVNQLYNYDVEQNALLEDMIANNTLLEAARAWTALIRSKEPTTTDGQATITFNERSNFRIQWGIDPDVFSENTPITYDAPADLRTFETWLNDLKSYVELKDTDNQKLQIELQRKSDRRDEALLSTVSFARKSLRTGNLAAANLG